MDFFAPRMMSGFLSYAAVRSDTTLSLPVSVAKACVFGNRRSPTLTAPAAASTAPTNRSTSPASSASANFAAISAS